MGAISAPATAKSIIGAYNVKAYGAKGDLRQVVDATITSGSPVVTSATAAFTQADVGKTIRVTDGTSSTVRLNSTILSVQSATQATANANAGATNTNRTLEVATDDTASIQAAINAPGGAGGPVYVPYGNYLITSSLTLLGATQLIGAGGGVSWPEPGAAGTSIWCTSLTGSKAIITPSNAFGVVVRNLKFFGPGPNTNNSGSICLYFTFSSNARIVDCVIQNFYDAIQLNNDQNTIIQGVHADGAKRAGLYANNSANLLSIGNLWANIVGGVAGAGNIVLDGGTHGFAIHDAMTDESFSTSVTGGSVVFANAQDGVFATPIIYLTSGGNGIYVGASSARITILGTSLSPFSGGKIPTQTIKIAAGATDIRLVDVSTNANGGGDISDLGTGTVYRNVNGYSSGNKPTVTAIAVDTTLTAADSGKVLRVTGVDKVVTLPATVAGLRYTFVVASAALSSGTGFQIAPAAADKIMGSGITSADNKSLQNTGATDAEGDTVTLVADGVDGWYVEVMRGTWARAA